MLQASMNGPVAQRITRLTTDQKIAGSNPAWINKYFIFLGLLFKDNIICSSVVVVYVCSVIGGSSPALEYSPMSALCRLL
jgi:hypothetical protein